MGPDLEKLLRDMLVLHTKTLAALEEASIAIGDIKEALRRHEEVITRIEAALAGSGRAAPG